MKLLVKLGGTLLDEPATRDALTAQLAAAVKDGHRITVVHGGGKQITRFLTAQGIQSEFIEGLRVTTLEVIDAVLKVVAGSVNHQLVAALQALDVRPVGLSGIDAGLMEAEPIRAELGAVGRPVRCDSRLLNLLTVNGYLPVVACIAGDRAGRIYNVNADQMAVACAAGFAAERLYFLTDVEGVRGGDGQPLPSLTPLQMKQLIADGVATGGMQAKLNAAMEALRLGVPQVVIAHGAADGVLSRLLRGDKFGTRIEGDQA